MALTAYRKLTKFGVRDDRAYEVSVRIYRHHHPEQPRLNAFQVVADWLDAKPSNGAHDRPVH